MPGRPPVGEPPPPPVAWTSMRGDDAREMGVRVGLEKLRLRISRKAVPKLACVLQLESFSGFAGRGC